jgi:hypothetical protein
VKVSYLPGRSGLPCCLLPTSCLVANNGKVHEHTNASFTDEVDSIVVLYDSAAQWAERTFAPVDFGDPRRTRRLIQTAARIADRPHGSLPSKFDWNGLRAAYRLMNRPEATHEEVIGPHCRQFVRGVARLGGFLGRRGDGSPGWKTLWRGYQRLQDMVEGAHRLAPAIARAAQPPTPDGSHETPQTCW